MLSVEAIRAKREMKKITRDIGGISIVYTSRYLDVFSGILFNAAIGHHRP
jgi:hypothetical protein